MAGEPHFTADALPEDGWQRYRRTAPTWMAKVDGPFSVQTPHGIAQGRDGFVALDEDGYPYPVTAEAHAALFALVDADEGPLSREEMLAVPSRSEATVEHVGGGMFDVTLPDGSVERVRGREAADELAAEGDE